MKSFSFRIAMLALSASMGFAAPAQATVKPAALFSDHMVVQQQSVTPVWGWGDPGEKVTVSIGSRSQSAVTGIDGRWMARVSGVVASAAPTTLTIKGASNTVTVNDVLVGDVWLASGQSNMDFTVSNEHKSFAGVQNQAEEIAAANYPQIRMFTVDLKLTDKPQDDVTGHWAVCSPQTVGDMSAVAYMFAREIYKDRKIPVGIIDSTWGGSSAQCWISRETLVGDPLLKPLVDSYETYIATWTPESAQTAYQASLAKWNDDVAAAKAAGKSAPRKPKEPRNPHEDQHNPYLLYNGMIVPVAPYAIRGAIWYQGESNGPTAPLYLDMMQKLVGNWRAIWGQGDFPFIQVQLAGSGKSTDSPIQGRSQSAVIRFAQLNATKTTPNVFMATAVDIGDAVSIHPKNKQEVGRRLGLVARSQVYGEPGIEFAGPLYDSVSFDGTNATIKFAHADSGLEVHGDKLTGFAISGDGQTWFTGTVQIVGNTVVVTSDQVAKPTAVRYAWADMPVTPLYNKAGLPASPFATDVPAK